MAGMHWQIRTTESYNIYDGLWYAEPVFHTVENRLGIMDDIFLGWLPAVDGLGDFVVGQNDSLSGKSGPYSRMRVHWADADTMKIVHMHPNHPFMEAPERPLPVATFGKTSQTIAKAAPDEKFNNGAANSLEDFAIQDGYFDPVVLDIETTTNEIKQFSGNGFIWLANKDDRFSLTLQNVGGVDNSFGIKNKGNGLQTSHVVGRNSLGFRIPAASAVSNSACRGLGYRSWCFTPQINKQKLTFSMVVKTTAPNLNFLSRVGYPGNWQFFSHKVTAVGQRHLVIQFDPTKVKAENLDKPLCIDWFYDAYFDQATFPYSTNVDVIIGSLSLHQGWYSAARLNPAFLLSQFDRQQQTVYGLQEYKEYKYNTNGEVIFPSPMLTNEYRLYLTSSKTITVTEKTRYGFTYTSDAEDGEEWILTYSTKIVGDVSDIV